MTPPRRSKRPGLLGLACLVTVAIQPVMGFFRPTARVRQINSANAAIEVPKEARRHARKTWQTMSGADQGNPGWQGAGAGKGKSSSDDTVPQTGGGASDITPQNTGGGNLPRQSGGGVGRDMAAATEGGMGVGVDVDDDEYIKLPPIEVVEMGMTPEEREILWTGVWQLEGEAKRVERAGKLEEAKKMWNKARELRYKDPYTGLEEQLQEAVKKEEFVKAAKLRLQMTRIGAPPNPEAKAKAVSNPEGKGASPNTSQGGQGSAVSGGEGYSPRSVTVTNGVMVEVRSQYYPEESRPAKDQYIFIYRVKITNSSPQTVQLVSRTWEIRTVTGSDGPQVVKGPGVVGQQPVLEPGESFEYSSACPLACAPKDGHQV
ncbi:unnamed protein product, partial [Discosporangium mesarthrocarpum]